jgi:hypothetical protein
VQFSGVPSSHQSYVEVPDWHKKTARASHGRSDKAGKRTVTSEIAEVTLRSLLYGLIQLTVLSVLVETADGLASASVTAAAGIDTTTVPLAVIPVTVTV